MALRIAVGDVRSRLRDLPDESVHCIVTSPPYYGLRDYGVEGQIGLFQTPDAYVAELVAVFREARRVLRRDGTFWLNIGDSYAGSWGAQSRGGPPSGSSPLKGNGHIGGGPKLKSLSSVQIKAAPKKQTRTGSIPAGTGLKPKDLIGIPWMLAFALRADGWWLRRDIVWNKPSPMPESTKDRCTTAHEYIFHFAKAERYYYDAAAIAEPTVSIDPQHSSYRPNSVEKARTGRHVTVAKHTSARSYAETRNRRSVWTIATQPNPEAHFAMMPADLAELCIKAGCPEHVCVNCGEPVPQGAPASQRKNRRSDLPTLHGAHSPFPTCSCCGADLSQVGVIGPGTVLDCFGGAGTTGLVADRLGRNAILIELNPTYAAMAERRLRRDAGMFAQVEAEPPVYLQSAE